MNRPIDGEVLEASPVGTSESFENVTLVRDTSKITTSSPYYIQTHLLHSLNYGSKTERLLACFLAYNYVSKALAKQVYGETRLQQRVSDLTATGFNIGRISYSKTEVSCYFLPKESIPKAQTRINELRVFRKQRVCAAQPINWEVSA